MVNITEKALSSLEEEFGKLPSNGFLAGGALANRIFEMVSGRKMPINDIDIFHFNPELLDIEQAHQNGYIIEDKKCFHAEVKENFDETNYGDYIHHLKTTKGYIVNEVKREGLLNEIFLKSSHLEPLLILESFDLNCTQIGYDLSTKKVYYTAAWEEFLDHQKIQITSLHTPSHTLLRLFKKADEFGISVEDGEFELIRYSLDNPITFQRLFFADKYKLIADKYQKLIQAKNFIIKDSKESSEFLSSKIGQNIQLWQFVSSRDIFILGESHNYFPGWSFNPISFLNSNKLIWAYRNIYPKKELYLIWDKLHHLYEVGISFESLLNLSIERLNFLNNLYLLAPTIIEHIQKTECSFEQHISYIDRIWLRFEPEVAFSLCQKLNIPLDWNENDELLMELSVRLKSSREGTINKAKELEILWKQVFNI